MGQPYKSLYWEDSGRVHANIKGHLSFFGLKTSDDANDEFMLNIAVKISVRIMHSYSPTAQ